MRTFRKQIAYILKEIGQCLQQIMTLISHYCMQMRPLQAIISITGQFIIRLAVEIIEQFPSAPMGMSSLRSCLPVPTENITMWSEINTNVINYGYFVVHLKTTKTTKRPIRKTDMSTFTNVFLNEKQNSQKCPTIIVKHLFI